MNLLFYLSYLTSSYYYIIISIYHHLYKFNNNCLALLLEGMNPLLIIPLMKMSQSYKDNFNFTMMYVEDDHDHDNPVG